MNLDHALLAGWLLTTAVHGLLWSGLALGLGFLLRTRALAWQDALLRLALFGGLATGSLQWALGGPLLAVPVVAVPGVAAPGPVGRAAAHLGLPPPVDAAPGQQAHEQAESWPSPWLADTAADAVLPRPLPMVQFAVGSAFGMALLGVLAFVGARRRLMLGLCGRVPEGDPRVLAAAAAVAHQQGLSQTPHLSRCAALASPVAFGLLRPEICLPDRTGELGDDELRALFGHELAHVRRGDALWLFVGASVQALLPWHLWLLPLRRRLCEVAELRCDNAAARAAGPVAVANCLVQVATWVGARRIPVGAMAMAARPSLLRQRVEHALAEQPDRALPRGAVVVGTLLLGVVSTAAAPGVRAMPAPVAAEVALFADLDIAAEAPDDAMPPPAWAAEWRALREEQAALARQARELQSSLGDVAIDQELQPLLDLLAVRLAAMERAGERLDAELNRAEMNPTSGSPRRTR